MYKFLKYSDSIELRKYAKKKIKFDKVFRFNFHKNNNDEDQLMMIWQKKKVLLST